MPTDPPWGGWPVLGLAVVGLIAVSFLDPVTRSRILGLSPLSGSTISDRFEIWRSAWQVLSEHPLLGVGPSGFLDAVPATYDPAGGSTLGITSVLDAPHSWPLQFALAGGWPLLILALGAAVAVVVIGLRAWWTSAGSSSGFLAGALAAIVASGIGLLTHLTSPGDAILPCFLIGVLIARPTVVVAEVVAAAGSVSGAARVATRIPIRIPTRAVQRIALGVWALFLLVAAFSEIALQSALDEIPRNAAVANSELENIQAVRFWDADLSSIAAESFAAATDQKIPGSPALAVSWALRSQRITPGTQASLVALGVGETAGGHLAAGASALSDAVRGDAANEQAFYRLGVTRALQKNYPASRGDLVAAAKLDPTDAAPWDALAYVYQQLGSKSQADAAHARAVALGG
jgi:hypothetical protein